MTVSFLPESPVPSSVCSTDGPSISVDRPLAFHVSEDKTGGSCVSGLRL